MPEDDIEQRAHIGRGLLQIGRGITVERRGVDDGKVHLFFICTQLVEQIERMIDHSPAVPRDGLSC